MKWADIERLAPEPGGAVDWQACLFAFPALELAKTTPQSPVHHGEGDVWTHTKMVVEELLAHPDYALLSREERVTVFLAALLHDIAKYSTTVIDPVTGAIGQPGHSKRGAIDARLALWDAEAPLTLREDVCRLISVHQVPFFAFEAGPGKPPVEFTVRRLSWMVSNRLLGLLAEADMRGRVCHDKQKVLDAIELFRESARIEGCYDSPKAFASVHTALSYFRGALVDPSFELRQEPGSSVILMSGLPASGKNTWAESHYPGLPVVSYDDAREQLGLRHGKNEGMVAHAAIDKAKDLLRKGAPFIWNATHLSPQTRSKPIDLLLAYSARIEIAHVEAPRKTLMGRNNRRDTSLRNKSIEAMLFKWEPPLPTEAHRVRYIQNP